MNILPKRRIVCHAIQASIAPDIRPSVMIVHHTPVAWCIQLGTMEMNATAMCRPVPVGRSAIPPAVAQQGLHRIVIIIKKSAELADFFICFIRPFVVQVPAFQVRQVPQVARCGAYVFWRP